MWEANHGSEADLLTKVLALVNALRASVRVRLRKPGQRWCCSGYFKGKAMLTTEQDEWIKKEVFERVQAFIGDVPGGDKKVVLTALMAMVYMIGLEVAENLGSEQAVRRLLHVVGAVAKTGGGEVVFISKEELQSCSNTKH